MPNLTLQKREQETSTSRRHWMKSAFSWISIFWITSAVAEGETLVLMYSVVRVVWCLSRRQRTISFTELTNGNLKGSHNAIVLTPYLQYMVVVLKPELKTPASVYLRN